MNRMHKLEIMYATVTPSPFGRRFGAKVAADITANLGRYKSVEDATGVPAWLVGILHHMECGGDFKRHLHNGDPLHSKTINVPKGRPNLPAPWTWEQSAVDALTMPGAFKWDFTTLGRALDCIERYNGTGYQRRIV